MTILRALKSYIPDLERRFTSSSRNQGNPGNEPVASRVATLADRRDTCPHSHIVMTERGRGRCAENITHSEKVASAHVAFSVFAGVMVTTVERKRAQPPPAPNHSVTHSWTLKPEKEF